MKKVALLGLGLLLFVSCKKEEKVEPTSVEAGINGVFTADSTSTIAWIGSKQTGKHSGSIKIKNGEFTVENGKITEGKFTIDMNTISVEDLEGEDKAKLEGHLKGLRNDVEDHFFNVAKYPEAVFEVTAFMNENGSDMLEGNLTIKNKTNKIKFPISVSEEQEVVTMSSAEFNINRTLWGVNYGSKSIFDDLGDKFIDDDITLQINLKAKK
jgi:polyisoprenoid-binding protein YceI